MPLYKYKAADASGKIAQGSLQAESLSDLKTALKSQGLFLMKTRAMPLPPSRGKVGMGGAPPPSSSPTRGEEVYGKNIFKKSVPLDVIALFTTEMAIMIGTALPIMETLRTLEKQQRHSRFKKVIGEICESVEQGNPLSKAFSRFPEVFDPVYLSLLASGEMGGKLSEMLDRINAYLHFQRDIKSKVRSALVYPTLLLLTCLSVVGFMVLFILPTFAQVFAQFDIQLPLPTRILLFISAHTRSWWWLYLPAVAGLWIYFSRWLSKPIHVKPVARFQLKLPVVGPLVRNIVMARVLRTLAALVSSGVPILRSLELARTSAANAVFRDIIDRIYDSANQGQGLASSLQGDPHFPEQVTHMIANAEKTGTLPKVLNKVADFYEQQTDTALKNVFAILEPVFVGFLGCLVAAIALSVLLPIFRLDSGIG